MKIQKLTYTIVQNNLLFLLMSTTEKTKLYILYLIQIISFCCLYNIVLGGARGVMVIVAGYGHGDTSSNPGPDWLHFS